MSQSIAVIAALIAGLIAGVVIDASDSAMLREAALSIRPIGGLWLSLLQMTVIPLIVSLLITGIASATSTAATGGLTARALLIFLAFLTGAATLAALLVPLMLELWPVSQAGAVALRASLASNTALPEAPALGNFFDNIVPTNPFRAAADGALLPLAVFALFFGMAVARINETRRAAVLNFFEGVSEAMMIVVKWVLWIAPLGVFALTIKLGLDGGFAVAGTIGQYVVMMCIVALAVTLAMYVVVGLSSGISVAHFARAAVPAQVVAFSTQSSLASLPAMLTATASSGVPQQVGSLVLPLAVSLFRLTSPPVNLAVVLFVAHVYGIPIGPPQLALGVAVAVLTSLAIAGLPGTVNFFATTVPISLSLGVPIELLPLLIAVEVVPDIFRTVGNVTADMTVATLLGRRP
jgi:proton glutamate symport protein